MNYIVFYLKREHSRDAYMLDGCKANPDMYEKVACVQATDKEDLFRRMNVVDGSEQEYVGRGKLEIRSLSVGDVVVSEEGTYLCAGVGWEKVIGREFK
jgi:hypothetical protein